jgi:hypothetical protein
MISPRSPDSYLRHSSQSSRNFDRHDSPYIAPLVGRCWDRRSPKRWLRDNPVALLYDAVGDQYWVERVSTRAAAWNTRDVLDNRKPGDAGYVLRDHFGGSMLAMCAASLVF